MRLAAKGMTLTAKGVARQEGGEGDVIRVTNPTSGKDVMAKVAGPQRVEVVF